VLHLDLRWGDREALERLRGLLASLKGDARRPGDALAELYRLSLYNLLARLLPLRLVSGALFGALMKTEVVTTNPGPVARALEGFGGHAVVDFVNFPQIAPPARLGLIYTTFRGALRLVALHDEGRVSAAEAGAFVGEVWGEVLSLCEELMSAAEERAGRPVRAEE
jgi:hypothetical protein